MIPPISALRPTSIEQALASLADDARPYWGGTELLLAMREGLLAPTTLVDLKHVAALATTAENAGLVDLGAGTTHASAAASEVVRRRLPLLAEVESVVANPRVRNQGSIGGNLCFADPRSDSLTALIALHALVTLRSADQARVLQVEDFVHGPYDTALGDAELLTTISIPVNTRPGVHVKYQPMERPTVAVVVAQHADHVRIVIGGAGDVPVWQDAPTVTEIDVSEMIGRLEPLPDLGGSEEYKRHVAGVYARRAILRLAELEH